MRVRVRLLPAGVDLAGPALHAANHTGYLDILIVLSVTPGVFISKAGVLWLPLMGQLAAVGGTLFVNRAHRLAVVSLIGKVRRTLRAGTSVIFFPEATSSDGKGLLPFKTSLFEAARAQGGHGFPVRPIVLCYRTVAGRPIDDSNRSCVFWYGGANLARHLWRMMAAPGVDVDVKVLPERRLSGDRGAFATELRDEMLDELTSP